jgi:hypothetical protein
MTILFFFSSERSGQEQELKNHLYNLKCSISGQPWISIDRYLMEFTCCSLKLLDQLRQQTSRTAVTANEGINHPHSYCLTSDPVPF